MNSLHTERPGASPQSRAALSALCLGALGVVFGDIGTSPLYTMKTVLIGHGDLSENPTAVMGALSMVSWCLIIIVAVTYVSLITRADNDGEGGILALATYLVRRVKTPRKLSAVILVISMVGASLFLGDSLITPAISVLSAAEGLSVISTSLDAFVLPVAVVVLVILFLVQHRGTERIGRVFGPVMAVWFLSMAAVGIPWLVSNPGVLRALSPSYAFTFAVESPFIAFVALGATVLAVTGAEALYADLGHFGRRPIVLAWMFLVFPCLLINYFGQGALIMANPEAIVNPFFTLTPTWARIPMVLLATAATVIASQAVISGAFSVVRQAVRLSLLPRIRVVQTSTERGGQIYLPAVNAFLFVGVLCLVVFMGSSEALAGAYGIAITGTLLLELTLFLVFARMVWHWSWFKIAVMSLVVGGLEVLLFAANTLKIVSGGWFPVLVSAVIVIAMATWNRGSRIVFGKRREMEGSIQAFIHELTQCDVTRIPGVAVYPHGDETTVPLALRSSLDFTHSLHEHVVIITVKNVGIPHVSKCDRVVVNDLGNSEDGIVQIVYRIGFKDSQDVPKALQLAVGKTDELVFDASDAWYVLSVFRLEPDNGDEPQDWPRWQRSLFRHMERLSANRTQVFHLPPARTVVSGAEILI